MDIPRRRHLRRLTLLLREFPVVALLGARQVGKSTLARQLVAARRWPDLRLLTLERVLLDRPGGAGQDE